MARKKNISKVEAKVDSEVVQKDEEPSIMREMMGEAFWISLSAGLVGIARRFHGEIPFHYSDERHANKPYENLSEFYPYYLSQHSNDTNRFLHVLGTSGVIFLLLTVHRMTLSSILVAVSLGTLLCEFLAGTSNGYIEFIFIIVCVMSINMIRGIKIPYSLLFLGYGFAWIGHFFFERNTPATFIYPSYSLISDVIMWFQTVSFTLPLDMNKVGFEFELAVQSLLGI